jgi:hypothetical protein
MSVAELQTGDVCATTNVENLPKSCRGEVMARRRQRRSVTPELGIRIIDADAASRAKQARKPADNI